MHKRDILILALSKRQPGNQALKVSLIYRVTPSRSHHIAIGSDSNEMSNTGRVRAQINISGKSQQVFADI